MQEQRERNPWTIRERERNPWMILISVIAGATAAFLVAKAVEGWFASGREAVAMAGLDPAEIAASTPPVAAVDHCNHYAAEAAREKAELAEAGALAAGGGDEAAAATDAGASHGTDQGTLVGLSYENSKNKSARTAYRACMIREGYAS